MHRRGAASADKGEGQGSFLAPVRRAPGLGLGAAKLPEKRAARGRTSSHSATGRNKQPRFIGLPSLCQLAPGRVKFHVSLAARQGWENPFSYSDGGNIRPSRRSRTALGGLSDTPSHTPQKGEGSRYGSGARAAGGVRTTGGGNRCRGTRAGAPGRRSEERARAGVCSGAPRPADRGGPPSTAGPRWGCFHPIHPVTPPSHPGQAGGRPPLAWPLCPVVGASCPVRSYRT